MMANCYVDLRGPPLKLSALSIKAIEDVAVAVRMSPLIPHVQQVDEEVVRRGLGAETYVETAWGGLSPLRAIRYAEAVCPSSPHLLIASSCSLELAVPC